jgi:DNA-binding transcriptional MerR regulator
MGTLVTIGDFSRMTYLSIKSLRHYHELGLLEPADVDPATGYRLYRPDQAATAQVIRRLRDLGMPLGEVRAVLGADDIAARNEIIVTHLRRMEKQLEQTQTAVSSLRGLLEGDQSPIQVEYRSASVTPAIAIRDQVAMADLERWWTDAFDELHVALADSGAERSGPDGALYDLEFFTDGLGETIAFIPTLGDVRSRGRVSRLQLPAAELAVALHHGRFDDLDKTYGALGTFVSESAIGIDGPIRENYVVAGDTTSDESQHRTEVCWPVFRTTPAKEGHR